MTKKVYRVRNWKDYNEALVKRGSLTFWLDEKCLNQWKSEKRSRGRGRPEKYSDLAIQTGLTLKALFKLTFRATEGFIKSLLEMLKVTIKAPDYSLLCKRQKNITIDLLKKAACGEPLHLAFDTTGLKIYGEGEWKVRRHGWMKHRLWRKFHIAVNTVSHQIEAFELTDLGVQDCEGVPLLLNQIVGPIASGRGDGAYDRFSCYEEAERKKFRLITPPQRNSKLSSERKKYNRKISAEALKKRDAEIKKVRELGRKEWKIQADYHRRSLAETAMFRMKTLLSNRLSTRTLEHQKTEVAIWSQIINKMTMLGMPESIAMN